MEPIDPRFAAWAPDLAPGLANPGRVVKDRILYRAAKDSAAAARASGYRGDEMGVDLCAFEMPVDEAGGGGAEGGQHLRSFLQSLELAPPPTSDRAGPEQIRRRREPSRGEDISKVPLRAPERVSLETGAEDGARRKGDALGQVAAEEEREEGGEEELMSLETLMPVEIGS